MAGGADEFDRLFRAADLDRDGRISGTEAVSFFTGSGLPQPILARVWQFADQSRAGFLSRPEFYNALRLVTVAQSGRDLTPDIVQAVLKPETASKIPPPRISLPNSQPPPQSLNAPLMPHQVPNPAAPNMIRPSVAGAHPPGSFNSQLNAQRPYPGNFPPSPSLPSFPSNTFGNPPPSWPGNAAFPNQIPIQASSAASPASLVNENTLNAGLLLKGKTPMDDKLGSFVSDFGAYSLQGKPGYQPKPSPPSPSSTPPSSFKAGGGGSLLSEKNALRESRAAKSTSSSPNVASTNAPSQPNTDLNSFSLGGTVAPPVSKPAVQPNTAAFPSIPVTSSASPALSSFTVPKPVVFPDAAGTIPNSSAFPAPVAPPSITPVSVSTPSTAPAPAPVPAPVSVPTFPPASAPTPPLSNQALDFFGESFSVEPPTQAPPQQPASFPTDFPTSFPAPEAPSVPKQVHSVSNDKSKPTFDFQSDFFGSQIAPNSTPQTFSNLSTPPDSVKTTQNDAPKLPQTQPNQVPSQNQVDFNFFDTQPPLSNQPIVPPASAKTGLESQKSSVSGQLQDLTSAQPPSSIPSSTPVNFFSEPIPAQAPSVPPKPVPTTTPTSISNSFPGIDAAFAASEPPPGPVPGSVPGPVPGPIPGSIPGSVPVPRSLPVSSGASSVPYSGPGNFQVPSLAPTVPWPKMTVVDAQRYTRVFAKVDRDRDGKITGEEARQLFTTYEFPREVLKQVWELSDQDGDGMLSLREFCSALYLFDRIREGRQLPPALPKGIHFDEPVEDPRSVIAANRIAEAQRAIAQSATGVNVPAWKFDPSMLADASSSSTDSRSLSSPAPAPVLTPVGQMPVSAADGSAAVTSNVTYQSKAPPLEPKKVAQLDFEEAQTLKKKHAEAEAADRKIFDEEAVLMNVRQKIDFYKTKMVEIITFKSRCDNRLNEVLERSNADKRELEELSKKYDDNYKKMEGVASRLSQEELMLKDLQEKKAELYKAVLRLQQGGHPNSYLQEKADKLASELEELRKLVNKRAKELGLTVRPIMGSDELPFGWQSGLQENAIEWDDEWDEFIDEGYSTITDIGDGLTFEEKTETNVNQGVTSKSDDASVINSGVEETKSEGKPSPKLKPILEKPIPEALDAVNQGSLVPENSHPENEFKDKLKELHHVPLEKDKVDSVPESNGTELKEPASVAEKIQIFESKLHTEASETHFGFDHNQNAHPRTMGKSGSSKFFDFAPEPTKIPKPPKVETKRFDSFGNDFFSESPKFQGESPKTSESFARPKSADRYADISDSQDESLFVPHLAYKTSTSQTSQDGFNWTHNFSNFHEEEDKDHIDNRTSWGLQSSQFSDFGHSDYSPSNSGPLFLESKSSDFSHGFPTGGHVRNSSVSESVSSEANTLGFGTQKFSPGLSSKHEDDEEEDPFASIGTHNKREGPSALHFDAFFLDSGSDAKSHGFGLDQNTGFGSFHDVGASSAWHGGVSDGHSGELKRPASTTTPSSSSAWNAF